MERHLPALAVCDCPKWRPTTGAYLLATITAGGRRKPSGFKWLFLLLFLLFRAHWPNSLRCPSTWRTQSSSSHCLEANAPRWKTAAIWPANNNLYLTLGFDLTLAFEYRRLLILMRNHISISFGTWEILQSTDWSVIQVRETVRWVSWLTTIWCISEIKWKKLCWKVAKTKCFQTKGEIQKGCPG